MKNLKKLFYLLLTVAFFTSCEKETLTIQENSEIKVQKTDFSSAEKNKFNNALGAKGETVSRIATEISYVGELCEGTIEATYESSLNTYQYPELWDYYTFYGNEGDEISIYIPRTSQNIDPAFALYFGTTNNTDGRYDPMDGGPDMTFLAFADDEVADTYGGCYSDPLLNITLSQTGTYTLAVLKASADCGPGVYSYEIQTTGIGICPDLDNDGVLNEDDAHPNSNMSEEISFGGFYPGVANTVLSNGSTMADEVDDLIAEIWAKINSGDMSRYYNPQLDFQREMTYVLAKWYRTDRVITDREKTKIVRSVRSSRIFEDES